MRLAPSSVLPLYIGVSGHRDIPLDPESLRGFTASIQCILSWYRTACPYTEVRLMSLLASGADSVATQAALDIGVPVVGILPLPREVYAADFRPGVERQSFDRLCGLCIELHELPMAHSSAEDLQPYGPARDQRYAAGGVFLANHCHALIALWNGCDSGKVGGTAHVARMQLEGVSPEQSLDVPTSGPVHWIRSPRTGHDEHRKSENPLVPDIPCILEVSADPKEPESMCTATLYPSAWRAGAVGDDRMAVAKAKEFYASVRASIDRFNKDAMTDTHQSRPLAFPDDPLFLKPLDLLYTHADGCSLRFQRKANFLLAMVGLVGLVCFGSMVVFDELLNFAFTLFVFFGLLVVAYVMHRRGVRNEYDGRYFDYRNLAELCRVAYHLGLAGVECDPGELIPGRYRSSLSWIAYAVRAASIPMVLAPVPGADTEAAYTRWVEEQYEWYKRKLPLKQKALARRRVLRLGFFGAAIVTAAGFFAGKLYGTLTGTDASPWWDLRNFKSGTASSWIQALFDIFISIGAVFALFMEMKAYEDEIELYQRASISFKRAIERLRNGCSQEAARAVLLELGSMAVGEHAEWNAVHRARPLELPMG